MIFMSSSFAQNQKMHTKLRKTKQT